MELRKDPITRSWVVVGHPEGAPLAAEPCPFCAGPGQSAIVALPAGGPWQVRVVPHPRPLYRIETEASRRADGIYDRMQPLGAHEVIVESPDHSARLSHLPDEQICRVLEAYALRLADLKRDLRFKYITVFRNQGALAGQEWPHPHSQLTATTFVPRRIVYELRAARDYFGEKERCVFCDILRLEEKQGKRMVDAQGDFLAFCPYASRVPYETWIISRKHNSQFESPRADARGCDLATLLGRVLRRLVQVTQDYHMVVHTAPNTQQTKGELQPFWKTIAEDYHWHIEILPIVELRSKSYSIKEVYFNAELPEHAAERLRSLNPDL